MKIRDLTGIRDKDGWDQRRKLIPEYIKNSRNQYLGISTDMFLLGWFELAMLTCAIAVERSLRELKFSIGEDCKDKHEYITLGYTSLSELLKWGKEKNIISNTVCCKGEKLNQKRNAISHGLDRGVFSKVLPSENGGAVIALPHWFEVVCDLTEGKEITIILTKGKRKGKSKMSVDIGNSLEQSCFNTIVDTYTILNDIKKYAKINKIAIKISN